MKHFGEKIKNKLFRISKPRQFYNNYKSIILFIAFILTLSGGYTLGIYHYQIEALIGPVFGYKAHSGNIDLSSLQETYNHLASKYDGEIDESALIQGANKGMVNAVGDAYTVYMSPQEAEDFDDNLTGSIGGGIGAEISQRKNQITIIRVLANNPAIEAGLQANDSVLKINDESTSGWTVDEAVSKIRGEEGTTVKLTIQRGSEIKDYSITRAIINNPSVTSTVENGLGIMTISRFDTETGDLAKVVAQNFIKQDAKSIILDLRGNGGGYVNAAKSVASLWLDNKIIATERTGSTIKSTIRSGSNAMLAGIPTIVLVDESSASASEIVAGALQDHNVAKIVGTTTYGKGSVQQLINLNNGAELKITIARWYTPNNKNINGSGIQPDVVVNLTSNDIENGDDPQINKAKEELGY